MLVGDLVTWLNECVAGIQPAEPGFKRATIQPMPVGDLEWVKAERKTPYGRLASAWKKEGGTLKLDVEVPPNTTATIVLPAGNISEDGKPILESAGVKHLPTEGGGTALEIGSGKYHFEAGK